MTETGSRASDMAMKGGGYYSLATAGAKDVIDAATPLVLRAIDEMDLAQDGSAFTLADMGCADGGTSIDMVRGVVAALRRKAPGRPVAVYYTDQPRNDYNALFANLHGRLEGPALAAQDRVHVFAAATSFYRQILPAGSLDLGFSATAMHWLSRKPGNISNHVQAVGAEGAELAAFAEQGNRDWETILLMRAAELKPGGRLVFANFCKDEAGRYLGNSGGAHMFDTFDAIWRDFLAEGTIGQGEYVAMTLPQYYKTVEEFSAPLTDSASPVHGAGLRLEHIETRVTPCPYAAAFAEHGDAAAFAKSYIPTLRSWTESTFFAALEDVRPLD
ncbi:MAG: class I SAM-dependent methyltransferase [Rhodospirillales bacterium]|nr:class I SAM-dependent methyltransferase [Rhodospirillales bacterium]